LDYFGARYYGNALGRFTSPDEPFVDQNTGDPQSWNLYGYARNNPLRYVDADGRQVTVCLNTAGGGQQCNTVEDKTYVDALEEERRQHYLNNSDVHSPAFGHSGDITCGDQICGHVDYKDMGGVIAGGLGPGDLVLFGVGRSIFGAAARETVAATVTETAAKGVVTAAGRGLLTATEDVLLNNGTKAAARAIVEGMAEGAQKASLKRMLGAAGNQAKITLQKTANGGVRVMINRAGREGGQTMIKTVAADGSSKVVQLGVDGVGNLTHYDPKH
jgi:hypothetical protein